MTDDKLILEYTEENYTSENRLIERSLINYYYLRKKEDKTEDEEFYQNELYSGVLELFDIMSVRLEEELGIDKHTIYDTLMKIHIKT